MKKSVKVMLMATLLSCGTTITAQEKILMGGSGWNKIVIIDKDTKQIEWEHPINSGEECNCVDYTKEGNILYAYRSGAKLIDINKKVIWDFPVNPQTEELQTAKQLPDGGYLLGIAGSPLRVIELDKKGNKRFEITYDTGIADKHGQLRIIEKTPQKTYLIPLMESGKVIEIDKKGKLINSISAAGNVFSAKMLNKDQILVSCGDGHCYQIFDRKGNLIKQIKQDEYKNIKLLFVAEIAPWKENLFITNWSGHSSHQSEPTLIEVTPDNQVVWSLNDKSVFKNISSIKLIP
ncbi:MAG: hypothetical protein ACRDD8_06655 [Bacteroidales bacterium]